MDVQCYELFGGIAHKNHAFSFFSFFNILIVLFLLLIDFLFSLNKNTNHCEVVKNRIHRMFGFDGFDV